MDYEICIIGGGPSGYVAAIEAKRRGLTVAIIDQNELGGTCLNNGCIPVSYTHLTLPTNREV